MTLTIDLPRELEATLRLQAAQSGQDLGTFVVQAVREKIARATPFREVCTPFAQAVEAAGTTDEEFDRFFDERREEVWRKKRDTPS